MYRSDMAESGRGTSSSDEGERVRRERLREDGKRSLAVNLQETITLSRKLFELRDALLRALDRRSAQAGRTGADLHSIGRSGRDPGPRRDAAQPAEEA